MGSAIRNPRIHPGRGSARADSMIDGRTTVMGTSGWRRDEGPLAQRLGEGVGVGPAERLGPGPARAPPAVVRTQSSRSFSARSASRWVPAAPSSARAALVNSRQAVRDGATRTSRSSRRPPGRGDLGVDVDLGGDGGVRPGPRPRAHGLGEQRLGGLALVGAGHVGGRDGDQVGGACARDGRTAGASAAASMAAATRDGPSRLTSTAVSRGASKATVAAEWTTMSHEARTAVPRRRGPGRRG